MIQEMAYKFAAEELELGAEGGVTGGLDVGLFVGQEEGAGGITGWGVGDGRASQTQGLPTVSGHNFADLGPYRLCLCFVVHGA